MRFPIPFAVIALLTVTSSGEKPRPVLGQTPRMKAVPVAIQPGDPARRRVGALRYLGGLRLTSPDPAFGGFSSMRLEGDRFTLLSDGGNLVSFTLGGDWQPRDVRFGDLPGGPGRGLRKVDRDSESMTMDPATGQTWVGFEYHNAIWRYDHGFTRAERALQPPAMRRWPTGTGPESMVRLRDGRFLVLSEGAIPKGKPRARELLAFDGDPTDPRRKPHHYAYVPPAGYDPTDMAELPDGRLLVLNRRLSLLDLFTAKLTMIDLRGAAPGTVAKGVELATFARPLLHDNFEALAVAREGEDVIVWIASDDNQEVWEQSLLLKFRLDVAMTPRP